MPFLYIIAIFISTHTTNCHLCCSYGPAGRECRDRCICGSADFWCVQTIVVGQLARYSKLTGFTQITDLCTVSNLNNNKFIVLESCGGSARCPSAGRGVGMFITCITRRVSASKIFYRGIISYIEKSLIYTGT